MQKLLFLALLALAAVAVVSAEEESVIPQANEVAEGDQKVDYDKDDSEIEEITEDDEGQNAEGQPESDEEKGQEEVSDVAIEKSKYKRGKAMSCEAQIEEIVKENAKNRPVLLQELRMIEILQKHLKRLIDTKAEQEDIAISELDTGVTESTQKTLADLMEDVESGEGRSYSETKKIDQLLSQLKGKLRTALFRQRHKLVMKINSCRRIARAQIRSLRGKLLELREARRERRQALWRAKKDYEIAKGKWEEGKIILARVEKESAEQLAVIAKEIALLTKLDQLVERLINTNIKSSATADLDEGTTVELDELAKSELQEIALSASDVPAMVDIMTEMQRAHPKAIKIKNLLAGLRTKLRLEKARIEERLRRERAAQEARRVHKNNMFARIAPALRLLNAAHLRVKNMIKRIDDAIHRAEALDKLKWLRMSADGKKLTSDEKAADKHAHSHHTRASEAGNKAEKTLRNKEKQDKTKEKTSLKRHGTGHGEAQADVEEPVPEPEEEDVDAEDANAEDPEQEERDDDAAVDEESDETSDDGEDEPEVADEDEEPEEPEMDDE